MNSKLNAPGTPPAISITKLHLDIPMLVGNSSGDGTVLLSRQSTDNTHHFFAGHGVVKNWYNALRAAEQVAIAYPPAILAIESGFFRYIASHPDDLDIMWWWATPDKGAGLSPQEQFYVRNIPVVVPKYANLTTLAAYLRFVKETPQND